MVCDSVFSCADKGVYLLNSSSPRIERNVFDGSGGGKMGLELGGSSHAEIVHNRFDGLVLGVYARTGSSHGLVYGNVFDVCHRRLSAVDSKGSALVGR